MAEAEMAEIKQQPRRAEPRSRGRKGSQELLMEPPSQAAELQSREMRSALAPQPRERKAAEAQSTEGSNAYAIQPGDSLSGIAARLLGDASQWRLLQELNGIANANQISVGQELLLPSQPKSKEEPPGNLQCVAPELAPERRLSSTERAELHFEMQRISGSGELSSFFSTLVNEPRGLGRIFLEEFANSDLEPFIAPFEQASDLLAYSPDVRFQKMGIIVGQMAHGMNAFVGLVTGNEEKVKDALISSGLDVTVDLVTKKFNIKTTDGRISSFYLNGSMRLSDTAKKVLVNNLIINESGNTLETLLQSL